jgi:hypothetical protein
MLHPAWFTLLPWRWRWHIPLKHCFAFNRLQSITSKGFGCYLLHASFLLGLFFNLEDEGRMSLQMWVDFKWTPRHYISEDRTLHNHCNENLKSYHYGHVSYELKNVLKIDVFSKYYSAINTYLAMASDLECQCCMFSHGLYCLMIAVHMECLCVVSLQ